MCLAVPAQIKSIKGLEAEVQLGGITRPISLWLVPEARLGDYVYVHAGFAISIVDEDNALESLRLLHELAHAYPAEQLFYSSGDSPHFRNTAPAQPNR